MASDSARHGTPSAGHMIVRSLEQHGVERVYVVPGESYLDVLDGLRLVRMPYHLSTLTQAAAEAALEQPDSLLARVDELSRQRDRIVESLRGFGFDVIGSDANFVLFRGITDPGLLWQRLVDRGVLVRDVGISGSLRVNAGTDAETTAFLAAVEDVLNHHPETLGRSSQ